MPRIAVLAAVFCLALSQGAFAWQAGQTPPDAQLLVLRAASPTIAFAGGQDGALSRTTDGGRTWASLPAAGTAAVRDVATLGTGASTILVLDVSGHLARSRDDDATWQQLSYKGTAPAALAGFRGTRVLLVQRRGLSLSKDSGDTFKAVAVQLAPADSLASVDKAGSALFAYGRRTILRSADGGGTWRHLALPPVERSDSLRRVDFIGAKLGYALTNARRLFRTRDAGHTWIELFSSGGAGGDMSFSDARHGYITAAGFAYRYNGAVLRTADGGLTWRPQIVSPNFLLSVQAAGTGAFALAGRNELFFDDDPGVPPKLTLATSARRVKRGGPVTIKGTTSGEEVVISARTNGRWVARLVKPAANGTYRSTFKPSRSTFFVAQVLGKDGHAGAGTPALFVRVTQ